MELERCCYCDYRSTQLGVRAHIIKAHPALAPPNAWGASKGPPCHLCGWVHTAADETTREGWARYRKRFQRGKIAAVQAQLPGPNRMYTLGSIIVPPNVTRIRKIVLSIEHCRGPFKGLPDSEGRRYCMKDRRYHFVAADMFKSKDSAARIRE